MPDRGTHTTRRGRRFIGRLNPAARRRRRIIDLIAFYTLYPVAPLGAAVLAVGASAAPGLSAVAPSRPLALVPESNEPGRSPQEALPGSSTHGG